MSITTAKSFIEVPAVAPRVGGVLSVATVIPATEHSLLGAEYLTDACAEGGVWADICSMIDLQFCAGGTVTPPPGGFKQFGQPDLVEGSPFAVYDGVECALTPLAEAQARAEARLGFSESRQVDHQVAAALDAAKDASLGAVGIGEAIMALEDVIANSYGGYGTILMPYSLVACAFAAQYVVRSPGGGASTINGTTVTGYATPTPATADNVFAVGRIVVVQGPVKTFSVPSVTRPDGTCDPARALAERIYVPLFECLVVGAAVTCPSTP
ncbi:MAG: hypothetical protein MUP76_08880 [Acidimicrobiia bacterium]|nr:hypothetical protein [Acidimicrobiia bacterium]